MKVDVMEAELEESGELHVVVEEHDAVMADSDEEYIGLRKGNTEFDESNGVIRVNDGTKNHVIDIDSVIYYHAPNEFPD